jgi:transposase
MPKYIPYDYNQDSMVVINFAEQIQPGTFEYAIAYLIDNKLDLSLFEADIKNDEGVGGRPAYDPAILLKIILFAYSKGITSSREIQWCCRNNIIFKALSCDTEPHFISIAGFVSRHDKAITGLFEQVLLACEEKGLLGNELFAIDGCKISSNASKEWSGTHKELARKRDKLKQLIKHHIAEHKKLDKTQADEGERAKRIEQTIETLDAAFDKVDKFLKTNSPRMGKAKRQKEVKSNITDNQSAKMLTSKGTIQGYNGVATVDKKHQVIVDAQVFGEGAEHHTLKPVLETIQERFKRLGISDDILAEQTIITADTGFANEANMRYLYEENINAYIPDNRFRSRDPRFKEQKQTHGKRKQLIRKTKKDIIPASEFDIDPIKRTCVCPAGESLTYRGERLVDGGYTKIQFEGRLLQCRNCEKKHNCMHRPESADHRKGSGRQVSLTIKDRENYTDWMKLRVDSDKGKQIYGHRMSTVEPVFANITAVKKLNRFSLRSKKKVNGQWQLFCVIHNMEKLMKYGHLAV